MKIEVGRRGFLALGVSTAFAPAAACAQSARTYAMSVRRDPSCGCCHTWTAVMQRTGRFRTTMTDEANMAALKQRLGVPADLASCHTSEVEGYVIEGHVPAREILRLLSERPDIRGLAVAGMPIGSPGMEAPDVPDDGYDVIAFSRDGRRSVYARYEPGA
ncbi:MAG: DUF411 domain-containing protein [Hyphomonadaceae bacterium]